MRKHTTIRVDSELYERAIRMMYWERGYTFTSLAHKALKKYIDDAEHARIEEYPPIPQS